MGAAVRPLLVRWCVAERKAHRALDRVTRVLSGASWAASTPDERIRLGLALHDALEHTTTKATAGLFEWERRWYADSLPPPGARLLVGAAGSGREVLALLEAGYTVDAFEPAPDSFSALRANVEGRASIWQLRYQELTEAVEGGRGPEPGSYDAVILGWGSLGYIPPEDARALLPVCDALAPRGPILTSLALRTGPPRGLGRVGTMGARIAGGDAPPPTTGFLRSAGFVHAPTRDEVEALGRSVGRDTRWGTGAFYPHLTWLAPG